MDPVDGSVTRPTEHDASTGNGMSMADDNHSRSYRSPDPYRRGPASPSEHAGGSDPLAELARLIGQSDPFAELGRSPREAQPVPHASPSTVPDWQAAHEQHFAATRPPAREPYPASDDHAYSLAPQAAYAEDHRQYAQHYDDLQVEADHQFHSQPDASGEHRAAPAHGAAAADQGDADQHYHEDGPLEPHEDEMYDDAPHARRHGGLITALALIGCAMLGTAGAYGYRSYTAPPSAKEPPRSFPPPSSIRSRARRWTGWRPPSAASSWCAGKRSRWRCGNSAPRPLRAWCFRPRRRHLPRRRQVSRLLPVPVPASPSGSAPSPFAPTAPI
jgi:hypothetical protein